jgi:hypothetical protein
VRGWSNKHETTELAQCPAEQRDRQTDARNLCKKRTTTTTSLFFVIKTTPRIENYIQRRNTITKEIFGNRSTLIETATIMKYISNTYPLFLVVALVLAAPHFGFADTDWGEKCYKECRGLLLEDCITVIGNDAGSEGISIQVMGPHDIMTMDYRLDRVRVIEDPDTNLVVGTPCRG